MITATYHGTVIARTPKTVYLEGNHYFPLDAIITGTLDGSWLRTLCYWKGIARYYHVTTGGQHLPNAAWSYPLLSPLAWRIRSMVAFDQGSGIRITEDPA